MSMETLLKAEIEDQFGQLSKITIGTEEYRSAVDGLTKLMDRAIEINKFDNELQNNIDAREAENSIKLKQIEEDRKDRLFKNILTGVGIVVPSGITVWGVLKSLKVEFKDDKLVTATAGKEMLRKVFSLAKK